MTGGATADVTLMGATEGVGLRLIGRLGRGAGGKVLRVLLRDTGRGGRVMLVGRGKVGGNEGTEKQKKKIIITYI